jgi:hypothetical protein
MQNPAPCISLSSDKNAAFTEISVKMELLENRCLSLKIHMGEEKSNENKN